ncbi:hypothetical protein, partial [Rhizobium sp.]|uniref:hypothetical protein n=1 Tax=Rhizobium sp. TaxID=391 RepID=UPI003F80BD12
QPPPVHEDHLSKVASWMLASIPAAIMNHNSAVLGIPKRFREKMIRSRDSLHFENLLEQGKTPWTIHSNEYSNHSNI